MKLFQLAAILACTLTALAAAAQSAPGPWDSPASALADQIANLMGPGQARLAVRNQSTLPIDQIPAIRKILEQALKSRGILASGAESATTIRLTLSENLRQRLWVAEVIEGSQTRVAIVSVDPGAAPRPQTQTGLTLRSQTLFTTPDPVLAALFTPAGLIAVEPEEVVVYTGAPGAWQQQERFAIGQRRPLARDPRALIVPSPTSDPTAPAFQAFLPGTSCTGAYTPAQPTGNWSIHCRESDDPWQLSPPDSSTPFKAFYNAARNYFTGITSLNLIADLPPFYTAAIIPRPNAPAPLINSIDGKIQLIEAGSLKPISGARDWGSDFAVLHSACTSGSQIIASGSGEATADSLRAFELPGQEAIPASAPLAMNGAVTALWSAPDGKSVLAVVRADPNQQTDQYEVDRVTATCD